MTAAGWLQIALFLVVLTALTPPLGAYVTRVFRGDRVLLTRPLGPLERWVYRLSGVDPGEGQDWKGYARSMLVFSALCTAALYLTLRMQAIHPLNPQGFGPGPWDVSFNTTISFVSNTSWQYFAGETTLSTFSQMAGIAVHSFLSAAVGLAVGVAVIRGFASRSGEALGCFWSDLTRGLLYVLLPLALVGALILVSQGVVQSLSLGGVATTLTGASQALPVGPVASQAVIKTMGSVGGGYFNVNSAMPFENATALSSFLQALLIVLVPAALTSTFGRMVGNRRQGWALYAAMLTLFAVSVAAMYPAESGSTPAMQVAGVEGTNLEGKEQRFGIDGTVLYAVATTTGSSGAVNGAMESLSGLGATIPLSAMMTGEVVFGGIGAGLTSMLLTVLLAVFLGGLMVGRTPEYLGKKLVARDIKLVMIGTIAVPMLVLGLTAVAVATDYGRASLFSDGPLGFTESLWAYASQAFTNGSAFAGYTGFVQPNAPGNVGAFGITFADVMGGLAMLGGRYLPLIAALAVAGSLAGRSVAPLGGGTLRTDTPTFISLLIGVVLLVALLTFVPALLLGPVAQGISDQLF